MDEMKNHCEDHDCPCHLLDNMNENTSKADLLQALLTAKLNIERKKEERKAAEIEQLENAARLISEQGMVVAPDLSFVVVAPLGGGIMMVSPLPNNEWLDEIKDLSDLGQPDITRMSIFGFVEVIREQHPLVRVLAKIGLESVKRDKGVEGVTEDENSTTHRGVIDRNNPVLPADIPFSRMVSKGNDIPA